MQKPITCIWGIGPSYRKRVKETIQRAIDTGYQNIMDYIILTDVPEDFFELKETTGKIIEIVNIHKEREPYPWSIEQEYIPQTQENYGDDYRENLIKYGKSFTHGLDRFSIPAALRNGYTKFVLIDPDTTIYYDKIVSGEISEEDFWKEFDSPVNSMRAPWKEIIEIAENKPFINARAMGDTSQRVLQFLAVMIPRLNDKFGGNMYPLQVRFEIAESALKYFHFESVEFGQKWFEVLNECAKISYSREYGYFVLSGCTGTMLSDFIMYNCANLFMNVSVIDFYPNIYWTHVYGDDRYFLPIDNRLKAATNLEEFYEINKDAIQAFKDNHQWPILG